MEQRQPHATAPVPVFALALAAGAAVCFGVGDAVGFHSQAAEEVFVASWLMGWVLLAWSAIVGGGYAVLLARRVLSRRAVSGAEVVLVAASLALIAMVLATYPLWGTGSAAGG
ncbi:hypothetical protein ACMX2H_17305 [Arthrobacter sulfonylureivorans]|uniref:hypothetical protein n=1 Tax=Arthrobacter sulfonylureivorans TaxID=2486855 RepID=UPI0039E6AF97